LGTSSSTIAASALPNASMLQRAALKNR
jgi:hypothetical protein